MIIISNKLIVCANYKFYIPVNKDHSYFPYPGEYLKDYAQLLFVPCIKWYDFNSSITNILNEFSNLSMVYNNLKSFDKAFNKKYTESI